MSETLVLDCGYQAIGRVPWETSIVWVLEHIAEVVDEHQDKQIRTVNWAVQMPSVVRFLKPIKKKKAIKFSRYNVYSRDKGCCQYCRNKVSRNSFTYDHVVPRVLGGKTEWTNVVVCCIGCNQRKAGRTPEQAGMHLLSKPVRPKSLPDTASYMMTYQQGMPESWKVYLRDAAYWDGTLQEG